MYRPIGTEWHTEGYWKVYEHPATVLQYLSLDQAQNSTELMNYFTEENLLNRNYVYEDGIYYVKDTTKDKVQRAITLEKFKSMSFDILISSIPQHVAPFNLLISRFQPKAKHIFQVGNSWPNVSGVKNVLASTLSFVSPSVHSVCYHQEFDLGVFKYTEPSNHLDVNSYIHFMQEMNLFNAYKGTLTERKFTTYGAGMDDCIHTSQRLADSIANSGWTWHVKPGGDGYGHILHNSFACGRPLIVKKIHYQGQMGEELMEDMVTCVDISLRSVNEAAAVLNFLSMPENHHKICSQAYKRFCDVVNFDEEEIKIRRFLERIL